MSDTYDADRRHVFHSWSAQSSVEPLVITRGLGSVVWDEDDREYLDFASQLVFTNIGHQHPRVVAAIQEQAGRMCTVAPQHAYQSRSQAARLIGELAPPGLDRVFFTSGGAEAVEHAVRMARLHTGRIKVLSRYRSYHGATGTAINVTGDQRRWPNDYGAAGTAKFFGPFLYRSEFGAEDEQEECDRALHHLRRTVEFEGPETVAAIVLETIPGTAGVMPPPPGYLTGVRRICDDFGIVMILDEVMAGFGRAGRWLALDRYDVAPDLITFAKGVTAGYVPLGGVIISDAIAATFADRVYPGGLTFSGHPLACAAAVSVMETMAEEHVIEGADRLGSEVLGPGLASLAEHHPCVGEVRGIGTFWALELVSDRQTKQPLAPYGESSAVMTEIGAACRARGLLPFLSSNRIHVVPPCNIPDEEARKGLAILDKVLEVGDRHAT